MNTIRLSSITINGLFGMFNHEIPLNQDENITIIHGTNGVGKTTILKIVKEIFDLHIYRLASYKFSKIILTFTDGSIVSFEKHNDNNQQNDNLIENQNETKNEKQAIKYQFNHDGKEKKGKVEIGKTNIERRFPLGMISDSLPFLDRIGPEKWIDRTSGEILTLTDVIIKYPNDLPIRGFDILPNKDIPKEMLDFLSDVKVHFIQTQRLFVNFEPDELRHSPKMKFYQQTTIEKYSQDIILIIQEVTRLNGSLSASLDRTFPSRLLSSETGKLTSEDEIRQRYNDQNQYRNRLMDAGIIELDAAVALPENNKLTDNDLKVLMNYLEDVDQKFNVYDDVLKKIELFKEIINKRFSYKKMSIDRNKGFIFTSDIKEPIPLVSLSSGEQHEIVLAYELIFKVPQNSLILIDEPELSLHVTWQHKFLDDLQSIAKLTELYFIIATHSPQIVQNKRNLMVIIPRGDENV